MNLWEEENLSTKDTTAEFILSPVHTLFGGFTVSQLTLQIARESGSNANSTAT